jgi:hypothetical protein
MTRNAFKFSQPSLLQNCLQLADMRQGTTTQAAEKLTRSLKKRQGTTSVVPQAEQTNGRALAPEGCFSGLLPNNQPFSAACLVVPKEATRNQGFSP